MTSKLSIESIFPQQSRTARIQIEVSSAFQLPGLHLIGLPGPEIQEAKERIRSALSSVGLDLPRRRVVVNLIPAETRKHGTGLDLAMSVGILAHSDTERLSQWERTDSDSPVRILAWGELGLAGDIRPCGYSFHLLLACVENPPDLLIVPGRQRNSLLEGLQKLRRLAFPDLQTKFQAIRWITPDHFKNFLGATQIELSRLPSVWKSLEDYLALDAAINPKPKQKNPIPDQEQDKGLLPIAAPLGRVLGISAAGEHHLLLLGKKGVGKTHALEWMKYLCAGGTPTEIADQRLMSELRNPWLEFQEGFPVREVGAQTRSPALLGSISTRGPVPGEYALAHGGILIADEFPEWSKDARESLREPLEKSQVTLNRLGHSHQHPSRFQLLATGNLCPCGRWSPEQEKLGEATPHRDQCQCPIHVREQYLRRLSGPILDRIDIVSIVTSQNAPTLEPQELKEKVRRTHEKIVRTWGLPPGRMTSTQCESILNQHPEWKKSVVLSTLSSLRARHKLLRISLSLAAWDGEQFPSAGHWAEAHYLRPERIGWVK